MDSCPDIQMRDQATAALEQGQVLFLPELRFGLDSHELTLLSNAKVGQSIKNISYNNLDASIKGSEDSPEIQQRIKKVMERYSNAAQLLLANLLPSYRQKIQIGRTSLRPVEIAGRVAPSYRKDDTRLHVDAFPANPNQGRRILRIFYNYNPLGKARVWRLGEGFQQVANQFLPKIRPPLWGSQWLLKKTKITKGLRTQYDHYMLNLHDSMKYDMSYQKNADSEIVALPAASTWIVYTDLVSHAALSGQHVLEQTFYLPVAAMQDPERSPLRMLEKMLGKKLA